MNRNEKIAWRDELLQSFDKSSAVFLAEYSGMTVEDLSALRKELRKGNAEFQVVKNTIAKKAIEGRPEAVASGLFKGPVGAVFVYGDVAAAAKTISETAKKNEKFKIVGGYMESAMVDKAGILTLASLPSREVLLSKIIGSLVAPHRGILGILNGVPGALVRVLNQIKETKSESAAG